MERHKGLEPPVLNYQESLKLRAHDPKMFANVGNPRSLIRLVFLRDHSGVFDFGFRNNERVSKVATLEEFFPVKILSKVRDAVNLRDKGQLFHRRVLEEIRIVRFQGTNNGFFESAPKLQPCLPHRNYLFVLKGNVKLLPEGREPIAVVVIEDV
jgi:hypothetical protein